MKYLLIILYYVTIMSSIIMSQNIDVLKTHILLDVFKKAPLPKYCGINFILTEKEDKTVWNVVRHFALKGNISLKTSRMEDLILPSMNGSSSNIVKESITQLSSDKCLIIHLITQEDVNLTQIATLDLKQFQFNDNILVFPVPKGGDIRYNYYYIVYGAF
jgi:hypothetical protein